MAISSKQGGVIRLKCEFQGVEKQIIKKEKTLQEEEINLGETLNKYREQNLKAIPFYKNIYEASKNYRKFNRTIVPNYQITNLAARHKQKILANHQRRENAAIRNNRLEIFSHQKYV